MILSDNCVFKPIDEPFATILSERFSLSPIASKLLSQRVKTPGEAQHFLSCSLQSLHSPFYFRDMLKCTERINTAIERKEKVYIFGDRDADGLTSITLIVDYLRSKGLDVMVFCPSKGDDYGFDEKNYDTAKKQGAGLVITVDVGVSCASEVSYANTLGIDTIVLDHHLPPSVLPECLVINPKCSEQSYPFSDLSAAGVVAKVIWACEFSHTGEFQKPRTLVSISSRAAGLVVECVNMLNFTQSQKKSEFFESDDEFFSSQLFSQLIADKELIIGSSSLFLDKFPSATVIQLDGEGSTNSSLLEDLIYRYESMVLRGNKNISFEFLKMLDLVAISTIADVMPLVDENRQMVKLGLAELNKRKRLNLQGILSQSNLIGVELTASDVAYSIAPVINSAGRMAQSEVALNMLLEKDREFIDIYSRNLLSLNSERQSVKSEFYLKLLQDAQDSFYSNDKKAVILYRADIPAGIIGLLSAAFSKDFKVTAIVMSDGAEGIRGSVRTQGDANVQDMLSQNADMLTDFGGHSCAGGFTLKSHSDLADFQKSCLSYISSLQNYKADDKITVDLRLSASEFDNQLIAAFDLLSPYGSGNPSPVFYIDGMEVVEIFKFSGRKDKVHCKMRLRGSVDVNSIIWNAGDVADLIHKGDRITLIAQLEIAYFRANKEYRLNIMQIGDENGKRIFSV